MGVQDRALKLYCTLDHSELQTWLLVHVQIMVTLTENEGFVNPVLPK